MHLLKVLHQNEQESEKLVDVTNGLANRDARLSYHWGWTSVLRAAIYFGRYRRHVQVIDAGESQAAKIPLSHNYPGLFGITGPELLARLRAQAEEYDCSGSRKS
jgi:hypothetical protein